MKILFWIVVIAVLVVLFGAIPLSVISQIFNWLASAFDWLANLVDIFAIKN